MPGLAVLFLMLLQDKNRERKEMHRNKGNRRAYIPALHVIPVRMCESDSGDVGGVVAQRPGKGRELYEIYQRGHKVFI